MLLALTGGQKLGLGLVAGIYVALALSSSSPLPRSIVGHLTPERLPLFLSATVVLSVGMMSALFFLAQEDEEQGDREHGVLVQVRD